MQINGNVTTGHRNYRTDLPYRRNFSIGNSRYPTTISVYLQPATLQYPEPKICLSMSNPKGGCFVNLSQIEELDQIIQQMTEIRMQILEPLSRELLQSEQIHQVHDMAEQGEGGSLESFLINQLLTKRQQEVSYGNVRPESGPGR